MLNIARLTLVLASLAAQKTTLAAVQRGAKVYTVNVGSSPEEVHSREARGDAQMPSLDDLWILAPSFVRVACSLGVSSKGSWA